MTDQHGEPRPPVTMSIMGGLGNQLFQFATGLEVAKRQQTELVLDLSWFQQSWRRKGAGLELRPYELGGIAAGVAHRRGPSATWSQALQHAQAVALRRLPRFQNGPLARFVYESDATFDPRVLNAPRGAWLSGYFASWRYFPTVADEVRHRFRDSVRHSEWATSVGGEVQSQGALGVHVRRGDYLRLKSTYGHVAPVFYQRAVHILRELGAHGPIWLFSDEPEEAAEWLASRLKVDRVVKPPAESSPAESMAALSATTALVIANSTFSWWAGFLNDAPSRYVLAPRPVWADVRSREPRDALLPTWLTVDCRDLNG